MSLTPDEIEAERTRFEAWQDAFIVERDVPPSGFRSWLAAIESERERVRKAQQDAEEFMRLQEPQRARMAEKWERKE